MANRCIWDKEQTTLFLTIAIRKNLRSKSKKVGGPNRHIYEEIVNEINQQLNKSISWDKAKDKWNHLKRHYKNKRKVKNADCSLMEECFGEEQREAVSSSDQQARSSRGMHLFYQVSSSDQEASSSREHNEADVLQDNMVSQSPPDLQSTSNQPTFDVDPHSSSEHQQYTEMQTVRNVPSPQEPLAYSVHGYSHTVSNTVPVDVPQAILENVPQPQTTNVPFSQTSSADASLTLTTNVPYTLIPQVPPTNVPQYLPSNVPPTNVAHLLPSNVPPTNVPHYIPSNVPHYLPPNVPPMIVQQPPRLYHHSIMTPNIQQLPSPFNPFSLQQDNPTGIQQQQFNGASYQNNMVHGQLNDMETNRDESTSQIEMNATSQQNRLMIVEPDNNRPITSTRDLAGVYQSTMHSWIHSGNHGSNNEVIVLLNVDKEPTSSSNGEHSNTTTSESNMQVDVGDQQSHSIHLNKRTETEISIKLNVNYKTAFIKLCESLSEGKNFNVYCKHSDGRRRQWNGLLLATFSPVIARSKDNHSSSHDEDVNITINFNYDIVKICIDIMRGISNQIPQNKLEDVTLCAAKLQITDLLCEILSNNLSPLKKEYCSSSAYFAIKDSNLSENDKRVLREYASEIFVSIYCENPDFNELSLDKLKSFIEEEGKNMTLSEPSKSKHLFWAILKWIKFNQAEQKQHLKDLLEIIELSRIPMKFAFHEKVIRADCDIMEAFAMKHREGEQHPTIIKIPSIVGYNDGTNKWMKYFPESSHVCELTWPSVPEDICVVGSCVKFNQSIFAAGGYILTSDFKCYKLDFMEVGCVWEEVNLPKNVEFPRLVVHNDTLYMMSWHNGDFYRYEDGQWIRLSKVPIKKCELTACGDYIYAHTRVYGVCFYRYDPSLDHWQRLQAMDIDCRYLFTWRGYVCVQNGPYDIYRYDVPSNNWEKITDVPTSLYVRCRCFEWNDDIVTCSYYGDEDVRKGLYTYDGFKWTKYFDYKDVENISKHSWMSIDI